MSRKCPKMISDAQIKSLVNYCSDSIESEFVKQQYINSSNWVIYDMLLRNIEFKLLFIEEWSQRPFENSSDVFETVKAKILESPVKEDLYYHVYINNVRAKLIAFVIKQLATEKKYKRLSENCQTFSRVLTASWTLNFDTEIYRKIEICMELHYYLKMIEEIRMRHAEAENREDLFNAEFEQYKSNISKIKSEKFTKIVTLPKVLKGRNPLDIKRNSELITNDRTRFIYNYRFGSNQETEDKISTIVGSTVNRLLDNVLKNGPVPLDNIKDAIRNEVQTNRSLLYESGGKSIDATKSVINESQIKSADVPNDESPNDNAMPVPELIVETKNADDDADGTDTNIDTMLNSDQIAQE